MRPGFGPPAEPARQLTRAGGGTPPAARRLTCGKRRAASASTRGPRPHSLTRSVSQTADAERNLAAVLRKLCARRDNHLFVGIAGVLRSTSPHLANAPNCSHFPDSCYQTSESEMAGFKSQGMRTIVSNSTFGGLQCRKRIVFGRTSRIVVSQPTDSGVGIRPLSEPVHMM